ncbi:MAG TPA: hypothetical protein PLK90_05505 [Clostridiales bacterium]|mgnify:CR=1 FL=1|jgi:hypothetical protein|nr:hypothetical protein [Clostridiales bacterium]HQP69838.1 hypothetical protein [Clostridiales bacterium]
MKKNIISFIALVLALIAIISCSKNEEQVKPAETSVPEPVMIVIDTMKVDSLIADTCEIDTFIFSESMLDSFSIDTSNVLPSVPAESFTTDLSSLGLRGSVRSVSEISYKAEDKFGEIHKGLKTGKSTIIIFEPTGMIREEQNFGSDGKILSSKRNIYDNSGNKIENIFDAEGKLDNSKKISYDNKGCIIEETVYNSLGILESKYKYKYSGGKLTEACEYNSDGSVSRVELYAYDENGNKTEENFYNSESELTDSHKFVYEKDPAGNLTVKDYYKIDGVENISWEKFDVNVKRTEQGSGIKDDPKAVITQFKYDEAGNIIEETCNNPEQIIKYTYEYDKTGNWIKRVSFEKKVGIPQVLTERTILYFE